MKKKNGATKPVVFERMKLSKLQTYNLTYKQTSRK